MSDARILTQAMIYWDNQDKANEGWAYRVRFSDGHEESGEWGWNVSDIDRETAMQEAVVSLAYEHGVDLTDDMVQGKTPGAEITDISPNVL